MNPRLSDADLCGLFEAEAEYADGSRALLTSSEAASALEELIEARARRLGERWSFDFEELSRNSHVEVTVRVGAPGSRVLAGKLTIRLEEADELHRSLGPGALVTKTESFL